MPSAIAHCIKIYCKRLISFFFAFQNKNKLTKYEIWNIQEKIDYSWKITKKFCNLKNIVRKLTDFTHFSTQIQGFELKYLLSIAVLHLLLAIGNGQIFIANGNTVAVACIVTIKRIKIYDTIMVKTDNKRPKKWMQKCAMAWMNPYLKDFFQISQNAIILYTK